MLRSAISSLSKTVTGAAKATIDSYRPSNIIKEGGAFERIAQTGIANLSYRSPLMADMAQTMLENMKLEMTRMEHMRELARSDGSGSLREQVKADLGKGASTKKVEAEMLRVIEKMSKEVDKSGDDATKKSEFFKKYEKSFTDLVKKPQTKQDTAPTSGTQPTTMPPASSGGDNSDILAKIEANTARLYNAIEEMTNRPGASVSGRESSQSGGTPSFIDPLTGMPSMRAAIGGIGGSFLAKVFDEDTITKFAGKARKAIGIDKDEPGTGNIVAPIVTLANKPSQVETLDKPKEAANADVMLKSVTLGTLKETTNEHVTSNITPAPKITPKGLDENSIITPTGDPAPKDFVQVDLFRDGMEPKSQFVHKSQEKSWLDVGWKRGKGDGSVTYISKVNTVSNKSTVSANDSNIRNVDNQTNSKSTTEIEKLLEQSKTNTVNNQTSRVNTVSANDSNVKTATNIEELSKNVNNLVSNIKNVNNQTSKVNTVSANDSNVNNRTNTTSEIEKLLEQSKTNTVSANDSNIRNVDNQTSKVNTVSKVGSSNVDNRLIQKVDTQQTSRTNTISANDKKFSTVPTPKSGMKESISSILEGLSLDLSKPKIDVLNEDVSEKNLADKRVYEGNLDIQKKILTELENVNKNLLKKAEDSKSGSGGIVESLLDKLGGSVGKGTLSTVANVGKSALSMAGPALAVAGAGAAGYAFGSSVVAPAIDKGISALTGSDTTLGGWIYDKMNPNQPDLNKPTSQADIEKYRASPEYQARKKAQAAALTAAPNTAVQTVEKLSEVKEQKIESKSRESATNTTQPVVVPVSSGNSGGSGKGGTNFMVAPSVRNQDSTFERVQMQDFWPRVA